MKKLTAIMLCGLMAATLAACGSSDNAGAKNQEEPSASVVSTEETQGADTDSEAITGNTSAEASADVSGDGKILVVYFTAAENSDVDAVSSASVTTIDGVAKGNVGAMADEIAAYTGADLFSIQTSVEYPGDIDELIDYALDEQDDDVRPELTSHIDNFDQYDTFFIGYPTWWYDLPQVMYSFFDEYDFSGKTIIPFNSANGSRFSGTIGTIEDLEPGATVITDGLSISHDDVARSMSKVDEWLNDLGY